MGCEAISYAVPGRKYAGEVSGTGPKLVAVENREALGIKGVGRFAANSQVVASHLLSLMR
jgi:hypothetical protein